MRNNGEGKWKVCWKATKMHFLNGKRKRINLIQISISNLVGKSNIVRMEHFDASVFLDSVVNPIKEN